MMLAEIRDLVIKQSARAKERACKKRPTDIWPVIDVFRGGVPIATIMILRADSQTIVQAYRMAVTGFDADQSSYVIEGYTNGPNLDPRGPNPLTGEALDNSTFSTLFHHHDGAARGWASECLFIHVANKAGDIIAARLPYHYTSGGYLVWDEPWLSPLGVQSHAEGAMADPMDRAMNVIPGFSQVFPGLAAEEVGRAELDVAVVEVMRRELPCHVMLWTERGSDRERTIRNRMPR